MRLVYKQFLLVHEEDRTAPEDAAPEIHPDLIPLLRGSWIVSSQKL